MRAPLSVAAVLFAAACGGGPPAPTSPSAVPSITPAPAPSPPAPFPTLTVNLTGTVVGADGSPIAGATVTAYPWIPGRPQRPPAVSTTTSAAGSYALSYENAAGQSSGGGALASKPGYEDDSRYVVPAAQASQTFRLYPITRLSAGSTASVTLLPDDPICGISWEWTCRTFRIVAPRSGTLSLEVSSETGTTPAHLEIMRPYRCCTPSASVPIAADEEVVVNVLMEWAATPARAFVLRTSLD